MRNYWQAQVGILALISIGCGDDSTGGGAESEAEAESESEGEFQLSKEEFDQIVEAAAAESNALASSCGEALAQGAAQTADAMKGLYEQATSGAFTWSDLAQIRQDDTPSELVGCATRTIASDFAGLDEMSFSDWVEMHQNEDGKTLNLKVSVTVDYASCPAGNWSINGHWFGEACINGIDIPADETELETFLDELEIGLVCEIGDDNGALTISRPDDDETTEDEAQTVGLFGDMTLNFANKGGGSGTVELVGTELSLENSVCGEGSTEFLANGTAEIEHSKDGSSSTVQVSGGLGIEGDITVGLFDQQSSDCNLMLGAQPCTISYDATFTQALFTADPPLLFNVSRASANEVLGSLACPSSGTVAGEIEASITATATDDTTGESIEICTQAQDSCFPQDYPDASICFSATFSESESKDVCSVAIQCSTDPTTLQCTDEATECGS